MIKEFALDPAVPAQSFQNCRYFLEALRIENGRVLACFPKKWTRLTYEAARSLHAGKTELSKIEECLRRLPKEALFTCGRPGGDPGASWLERAICEHGRLPFAAVIIREANGYPDFVIASDQVDSSEAFRSCGQQQIKRTSDEIVGCIKLLLRIACTVKLIDPHFDASKPRWRRGLQKLLEIVPSGSTIEIHRKDDAFRDNQRRRFDGHIARILPEEVTVKVFLHPEAMMHNRYILTEQGGASYGTGLDDNEDGDGNSTATDDVVLLSENSRKAKWNEYANSGELFLTI